MKFEKFKKLILKKLGNAIIYHEEGKHIAKFEEDVVIIGNNYAKKVTVKWGSGHISMIDLEAI